MTVPLSAPGLWLLGLERAVMLGGLALALGGIAGRGALRNYKGTGPAPLPEPWALPGSLVGLAGAAALLLTSLADRPLAASLSHPLVLGLGAAATPAIALIEVAFFTVAALLSWQGRGGGSLPLLGVVLAEAVRSHPDGMIPAAGALLAICHMLPAILWAGMLAYTLRAAIAWRSDPVAMQGLIRLYANVAAWLFSVVVVTGLIAAVLLVPLGSLLTTAYGRFLIAKAALVAVAACMAIAGRVALNRRAAPGAGPARATRVELGALASVLVVTAILTVITPPAKSVYSAQPPGRHHATVVATGSRAG